MKKILDVLRKLGVFRSGSVSGTYTSGKDRPTEFLMEDVYDSKKDLVGKKEFSDLKEKITFNKKSEPGKSTTGRKVLFWLVIILGFLFLVISLSSGFSFKFILTLIIWLAMFFLLKKFAFQGLYSFGLIVIISIIVIFISLLLVPSSNSQNNFDSKNNSVTKHSGKIDFDKKVLSILSENDEIRGAIGLEKRENKKTGQPFIYAYYNILLKADLPFNGKCHGIELACPKDYKDYQYSGKLVRSDKKDEDKGNGTVSPVFCNKETSTDNPFDISGDLHDFETCGITNSNGLKTETFQSNFTAIFDNYEDVLNSNQFKIYSFADFWEKVEGESDTYRGNTDLPVQKTQPIKTYTFSVVEKD